MAVMAQFLVAAIGSIFNIAGGRKHKPALRPGSRLIELNDPRCRLICSTWMSSDTDFVSCSGREIVIRFRRTQTPSGTIHFPPRVKWPKSIAWDVNDDDQARVRSC